MSSGDSESDELRLPGASLADAAHVLTERVVDAAPGVVGAVVGGGGEPLATVVPVVAALARIVGPRPDDEFAKARLDAVEDDTLALAAGQRVMFDLLGQAMQSTAASRAQAYAEDLTRLAAARHLDESEARAVAAQLAPMASSGLRFALDALDPDVVPHIARLVDRYSGRHVDTRFRAIARVLADLAAGELANLKRLVEALAEAVWCTRERRSLDGTTMGDPRDAARVTISRTAIMHADPALDVEVIPRPPSPLLKGVGPRSPLFDLLLANRLADTPRPDELSPGVRIDNRVALVRHEIVDELREVLGLPPPALPRLRQTG